MRLNPNIPVLARPGANGAIDVQIGLVAPVVLTRLGLDERDFLASLEGGRSVPPAQARRFSRVIATLTAAGAWAAPTASQLVTVAVHGCGELGMEIAAGLVRGRFDVALADRAPLGVEPVRTYVTSATGTCAGAAAVTLGERGVPVRLARGSEGLAVIVCTGAPDSVLVSACMLAGTPHVLVVWDGVGLWVSHVVVPGITACSRCRDVSLTRDDPAWPRLSLQLGGSGPASRRPIAPHLALPAVVARVATRVGRWAECDDAGIAERVETDGSVTVDPLVPEHGCGCGAAGPVGDELAARRAAWPVL